MHLKDLITDAATGQLSHSKLWSNIGYGALTHAFIFDAMSGGLSDMKLFAYGAIVIGNATASKIVSMKYKEGADVKPD